MNKMATKMIIIIISKPNQKQRLVNKNQFSTQWLGATFFLQSLSYSSSSSSTLPPPSHLHISRLILDQKSAPQALRAFRWAADLPSFTHDLSTYRALIHKLCVFRRFDTARQLLDEMPDSIGCAPDDSIFVTIIRGLGRARMTRQAVQVLDLVARFGAKPSLKVLNSVLDVLVKDNIDLAREFYRNEMMGSGVGGDDYTHGILMKGLCLTNRIGEVFKLLQAIRSHGVAPNAVIYNTLIHALCRNGNVGRARSLMSEMTEPNAVTFNILISGYCGEDDFVQALVLLDDCLNLGLIPDLVTVTKVLEVLCNADRVSEAVQVLERVEGVGVAVDAVAYNTLIKGFCRTGKPRLGLGLMKKMEMKGCLSNVETYNLLISGFCDIGMLDSALNLFHDMKTDGVKWNFATYNLLIRGLCSAGRTQDGLKILEIMDENRRGTECHIGPYNSVIYGLYKEDRLNEALDFLYKIAGLFPKNADRSFRIMGFCKEGKVEDAKMVYDQMIKEGGNPSAIVYAHLIHGFCQKGCVQEAFEVMNEMVGCGYLPVASTLNVLISGFCQQGMVGNASKLLEDMIERGCFPDTTETYSPLVDALCRKGNFQEALTLFLQMVEKGISPDLFIWNSLLLGLSREVAWLDVNHNLYVNRSLQRVIAST